jgi:uncharacterized protein YdaL
VLYDTTGDYGWLGEAYAVETANLVSHGTPYDMKPVANYTAGMMSAYSSVVYVGSTYDEPLPVAFLDDVLANTKPVLWMYDNIWQLTARAGNFSTVYGWTWDGFDFATTPTVTYKGVALQRDPLAAPSGLMNTHVTDAAKASVVATATRSDGTTLPWAVKGGNVTYVGEVPYSYVGPTDRYFAAADLVLANARPAAPDRKRALVRIEDVSSDADPNQLRQIANYLSNRKVPFTVAVIARYVDPRGVGNGGVPQDIPLNQAPAVVDALKYMQTKGGTLLMHGYTHQYKTVNNPYDGVSGNDFEYYTAHIDANNNVIYDGPVPDDSATYVDTTVTSAKQVFTAANLPQPTIFEPPHYAASAQDYQRIQALFGVRYDRGLFAAGFCPAGACGTGTPDYSRIYGQYYPFLVKDVFGSTVIPEALGNVELEAFNNHPPRLPADILASAKGLTVVKDGVQSFFYHPFLGTSYLKTVVEGLQGMGYTFTPAATVQQG